MSRANLIAFAALLGSFASAATASTFLFHVDPPDGNLFGGPGATVGYGYLISNPDPALWLITTNLGAGTLAFASGTSLFDFPVVGPGESVFVPYSLSTGAGLYEIAISDSSPLGYVNSGAFVLSAEFDRLDPDSGQLVFVGDADDQIAEYQITAVPEPRSPWTTGCGLAILLLGLWMRPKTGRDRVGSGNGKTA